MIEVSANTTMVVVILQCINTSNQYMVHVYVCVYICVCSVMSDSLQPYELYPTRLLCPWDSPGKNPGVSCHTLLQGIFLTQGSNPISYVSCIGRQILDC